MTAANVRHVIHEMEIARTNRSARKRMAQIALKIGNISEEGKAVYRAYLDTL